MTVFSRIACSLCPSEGLSMDTLAQIRSSLLSINKGIEFSPVMASWIFLVAAVNLSFPEILNFCTRQRCRRFVRLVARILFPWLAFHCLWIPVNIILCCSLSRYGLPRFVPSFPLTRTMKP